MHHIASGEKYSVGLIQDASLVKKKVLLKYLEN
jgi:hypothetical protein